MNRVIRYEYYSWSLGCECCSDSSSTYECWEDGKLVAEDVFVEWCSDESELREALKHLEPFDIHPDCEWF